ncbi:MAG: hypothetical protein H2045_04420 [Rhizobiales bacterium]|nr:hypothetical protein [Hyphomicrobiales bacterium]
MIRHACAKSAIRASFAIIALASVCVSGIGTGHAQGFSGLLTGKTRLAPITLSSGKPLAETPYELESGKYYAIDIIADGSAEIAITGPSFFRNVWVNEIVIEDIEIRPNGVDSLEFDDEGKATISFVTIRPGIFELFVPGTTSASQRVVFNVK